MKNRKLIFFVYTGLVVVIVFAIFGFVRGKGLPFVGIETSPSPWSIGIFAGSSPFSLEDPDDIDNPVLTPQDITDVSAEFVADPFMIQRQNKWFMFFEVMNKDTNQGDIGLASSVDGVSWNYDQIVLDETFHLSFPYVFNWKGDYYMVPETSDAGAIRLYRADTFPTHWSFEGDLVEGRFVDTTVFHHAGKWWLFTTKPHPNSYAVYLYHANDLPGPWLEHPNNPVVEYRPQGARSAGRVLEFGGKIIRYIQDIYPVYGQNVRGYEVSLLSETDYQEAPVSETPVIGASGQGWNGLGMHTLDPHQIGENEWIAVVDGYGQNRRLVFGLDK